MTIYDITLPMQASLACWPGDAPYRFRRNLSLRKGDSINLGAIAMSAHAGTHIDAPFHFREDGATVEALDLTPYLGAARVIDVSGREQIRRADIEAVDLSRTPRVLFRTNAWTDHTCFPVHIPVMEKDVPAYLQAQGVILVGLDVPSVDPLDSKDLPVHRELAACGIAILESLLLRDVPEGEYWLAALPLKLVGADGAPVRAVLMREPPGPTASSV
jgi:arylformamidase